MSIALCRYIGGKSKLARLICERLTEAPIHGYREPFIGAGSVGLNLIMQNTAFDTWINDYDPGIYCMWTAAARYPELLKAAIHSFVPSVSEFERIKSEFLSGIATPTSPKDIVRIGMEKIAVQQMSYGALGQMAGGALGGRAQKVGKVESRWNADGICRKIDLISPCLSEVHITNLDYSLLLMDDTPASYYLDPPYYGVGDSLYQHSFSELDHMRLSQLLRRTNNWLLSYNDCPAIRELYSFAQIERIETTYGTVKRRTNELLITPPNKNRVVIGYQRALAA
jgi:DNA adenine methylase